jgi:hypothetical protein
LRKPRLAVAILALGVAGCSQPSTIANPTPVACSLPSPSADNGAIAGQLGYPSDFIPALTVYAIPVTEIRASTVRASQICYVTVQTVVNQQTFHILHLPAGDYYVLAGWQPALVASPSRTAVPGDHFGGAYTQAVRCGLLYTCSDHSLISVSVQAGQTTAGIQVTDWYEPAGTFPKMPANAPVAVTLPTEPTAFPSGLEAAAFNAQLTTGGVYTQSPCPENHACVTLGASHDGDAAAYFVGTAGSNTDLQFCGAYVFSDSAAWHSVNVRCMPKSPVFPAVGSSGMVLGGMGETGCVNFRQSPGRSGKVLGCLALGTPVEIDQGPSYVTDPGSSLGPADRLWWHLKGRGWMVHTYLWQG